jgi:hypothetical protein
MRGFQQMNPQRIICLLVASPTGWKDRAAFRGPGARCALPLAIFSRASGTHEMASRPLGLKLSKNICDANQATTHLAAADAGDDHGHELDGFIEGQRSLAGEQHVDEGHELAAEGVVGIGELQGEIALRAVEMHGNRGQTCCGLALGCGGCV